MHPFEGTTLEISRSQTRVLVVQSAFLGDLVLTQPLVEELARTFHPAKVDILVRAPFAELARTFPGAADVLPFDKRGKDRGLRGFLRQRRRLMERGYSLAVSPHGSRRTGLLLRTAGIEHRLGFADAAAAPFFNHRVPRGTGQYADRLRGLLRAAGAGPGADRPVLEVAQAARESLERTLGARGVAPDARLIAMSPGSVWATKRWLPEGYAELCVELAARGLIPVLVGGKDDAEVTAEIVRRAKGPIVDLAGGTSLPELAALAERAKVFVSGDSGPMHVAAAVGTPVVAIFGPTTPDLGFAPRAKAAEIVERALECRPCHRHGPMVCPLKHFRCMKEIGSGEVMGAVERMLAAAPGGAT